MFSCAFATFPYGVPGQVLYLIVSIPDPCLPLNFLKNILLFWGNTDVFRAILLLPVNTCTLHTDYTWASITMRELLGARCTDVRLYKLPIKIGTRTTGACELSHC